jgi:hypothetical protein
MALDDRTEECRRARATRVHSAELRAWASDIRAQARQLNSESVERRVRLDERAWRGRS